MYYVVVQSHLIFPYFVFYLQEYPGSGPGFFMHLSQDILKEIFSNLFEYPKGGVILYIV